jgi:hypothetical protein
MVVGTVRNVGRSLEREIHRYARILNPVGNVQFFLVESDSNDSTVEVLNRLRRTVKNFEYETLGALRRQIPERVPRLIYCRNRYVERLRQEKILSAENITLVVDFDLKSKLLNSEKIQRSLAREVAWSGIFANQTKGYYDILALRHPIWCPNSILREIEWYTQFMSKGTAKELSVFSRMLNLSSETNLIQVDSAFGGLGIYKSEVFFNHDYTPRHSDSQYDIDHVVLNKKIRDSGGMLFIDPNLTNCTWTNHTLEKFSIYRYLNLWRRRLRLNF